MRLSHLLLTCCLLVSATLVVAQEEASSAVSVISTIPSGVGSLFDDNSIKINKEIEIEAKDIIVNIGKVDIEIEREKQKRRNDLELASFEDAEDNHHMKHDDDGNKIKINKEVEIEAKDIIVNIGKVKVEIEKDKHDQHTTKKPTYKPTWKPTYKPTWKPTYKPTHKPTGKIYEDTVGPIVDSPLSNTSLWEFEDVDVTDEPAADEVVLGENATAAAITVQGAEHFDERGVLVLTGPQIFSVTFKIVKEKVITIAGSDFDVADDHKRKQREAVTFIIRGRGFTPGGALFSELSDFVEGRGRQRGMFSILEPQVFLGAIPLKVVRFTDTVILARFLDIEDQRRFEAGTFLARVKVIHIDVRKEKKKHGPGEDIGILGEEEGPLGISGIGGIEVVPNGFPAVIAALNQRSLFTRSDGIITSPVLGVIENPFEREKKDDHHDHDDHNEHEDDFSASLLGLFSGLRFDTAVLSVQFSEKDAQKIRGAFATIFTDEDLGFPDI